MSEVEVGLTKLSFGDTEGCVHTLYSALSQVKKEIKFKGVEN